MITELHKKYNTWFDATEICDIAFLTSSFVSNVLTQL